MKAEAPTHWPAVAAVTAAGLAIALNVGKVPVALPVLRSELGLSLVQAGWVSSMLTTVAVFCAAAVGMWVGRWGALRMVLSGLGRPVDFEKDVYPILDANCVSCHNVAITENGPDVLTLATKSELALV